MYTGLRVSSTLVSQCASVDTVQTTKCMMTSDREIARAKSSLNWLIKEEVSTEMFQGISEIEKS